MLPDSIGDSCLRFTSFKERCSFFESWRIRSSYLFFDSLPSRKDVLSLKVGAFDPATFSDSAVSYQLKESSADVEVYVLSDARIIGDTSTIFKVVDEYGETVFLKNLISTITLGNTYSLRNPPSFMNLVKVELRDAEYEGKLQLS